MDEDKANRASAFIGGYHDIDYQMIAKPNITEIRITLKYDSGSAWDASYTVRNLQESREELMRIRDLRRETSRATAKATRATKAGRKAPRSAGAIGRSAAPLLLTYDGGEDEA